MEYSANGNGDFEESVHNESNQFTLLIPQPQGIRKLNLTTRLTTDDCFLEFVNKVSVCESF